MNQEGTRLVFGKNYGPKNQWSSRCGQPQQHLRTCQKCNFSGLMSDLQNQKPEEWDPEIHDLTSSASDTDTGQTTDKEQNAELPDTPFYNI